MRRRLPWRRREDAPVAKCWVKVKNPVWKLANQRRYLLFEGPTEPKLSERERALEKKQAELARVESTLLSPGLSIGIARALRNHQALLEAEIAELEQLS